MTKKNENKSLNRRLLVPTVTAATAALLIGATPLSQGSQAAGVRTAPWYRAAGQAGVPSTGQTAPSSGASLKEQSALGGQAGSGSGLSDTEPAEGTLPASELLKTHFKPDVLADQCRMLLSYSKAVSALSTAQDAASLRAVKDSLTALGDFMDAPALAWECGRQADYADALTLITDEDDPEVLYIGKSMLEELGDYRDAPALAQDCGRRLDYVNALSLLSHDLSRTDLLAAVGSFTALGDYEDAPACAAAAKAKLDKLALYEEALMELEMGHYDTAAGIFLSLDGFADARDMAQSCACMKEYKAALFLYSAGQFKEAQAALTALEETYEDADALMTSKGQRAVSSLIDSCRNERRVSAVERLLKKGDKDSAAEKLREIEWDSLGEDSRQKALALSDELGETTIYDTAMDYYDKGRYYEAYKAFLDCGSLKDAPDMAEKCIQPFPKAGIFYINKNFPDRSCQLTIDNTGFMNAFYKFYMEDHLILTVFIPENEKVTFKLPAGAYSINKAYGDLWFGTQDLFGDEGYYWTCQFGGTNQTASLDAGCAYAIATDGEGIGIAARTADRQKL